MFRGIRLSALGVTLSALVALHGCGGSGSDDGDDSPSASKAPGGRLSISEDLQPARAMAARAVPTSGSVTQSSDVDQDNITEDVVTVRVLANSDGELEIRVMYNDQEAVDTGHDEAQERRHVEHVQGRVPGTRFFERVEGEDYNGIEFYRSLADGDLTGVPAGDLWVDVYTNFGEGEVTEDDYLAGGIWVYVPDDGEADDYEFGAFADGASPYPAEDVAGLAGTAEYDGEATGVYSYGTNGGRRNEFFDASVALMADFDTGTAGEVSGRVYDFVIDDEDVDGEPELTLNSADLTPGSNFFTGSTSVMIDGDVDEDFTGNWGGQFFNDPDPDPSSTDDIPGAVAGTFGAANDDESVVGVFGAYHE
jgi:hypothetical protein